MSGTSALFVFDSGGDLHVFASARRASSWIEATDVEDGEYPAAYLHDGTVVELDTADGGVVLRLTRHRDLPAVRARVAAWRTWAAWPGDESDLLAFADEVLRAE